MPIPACSRAGTARLGRISEQLDKILANPPEGVQVLASCGKGQQAIELEKGSVFLAIFECALVKGVRGIQDPGNPLPFNKSADINQA